MSLRAKFLFLALLFSWTIADARSFVTADIIITEIVLETQIENKVPEALEQNELVCSMCENFTAQAVDYFSQNKTQEEIIQTLHQACAELKPFEQQCVMLVDYYATLFFVEIGNIRPEEFCRKVNLCEGSTYISLPRSNSTCVFCHHLVEEVLEKLKDPDSQLEIIQMLLKECNKMENYVKECKRVVLQYGPLILVNGEKFLETNDLCSSIHACKASQQLSLPSIEEEAATFVAEA